ncbi:MAG TPA: OsmC family protein [Balneolales bacterium]|nr:OsmC family protein [Balneolales bacterium]
MSVENIRTSMEKTISYLKANPEKTKIKGKAATAVLESGLKVRTTGPKDQIIVSDIPSSMGGGESAPAPGWYMQAALAACYASGIALKAAQESIELSTLEVSIDAESDARGFFGFDEAIKAGPLNVKANVLIGAKGVEEEKLRDLVKQVYQYSWVGNAVRRSVPIETEVEIV